ncbi:MAG: ABC transporter permease [Bryobacteraceae bacterium]|nr:ABC transporter permease [Bryobacteraceae bacterium]
MRTALLCARKDLLRMARDPVGLGVWLGMPILVALALLALFGREDPRPQGVLFIADDDRTFLSSLAARAYTQGELGQMITTRAVPLEEGRRRMQAGEGSALLVIPKGFSAAVLGSGRATLELVTNPSQAILPGMLEEITEILADGAWYLQQLAGEDLRRFTELSGRPPDRMIADFSLRIAHLIDRVGGYVDPPVIDVVRDAPPSEAAGPVPVTSLMFPSMVSMAVLFLAYGYAGDIWREKLGGTLLRTAVTPVSMSQWLGGKLLALGVLFGSVGLAALVVAKLALDLSVHNGALSVCWVVVAGLGMHLLMLLLQIAAGDIRTAHVTANITVMTLAMLGGSFFPFEMMPAWLARAGQWTPNGWALLKLRGMLDGSADAAGIASAFGIAAAVSGLLFWWASRRLRNRFVL